MFDALCTSLSAGRGHFNLEHGPISAVSEVTGLQRTFHGRAIDSFPAYTDVLPVASGTSCRMPLDVLTWDDIDMK